MIAIISALFMGLSAFAYIPEYSLLMSRAADQHGKGAYQIETEVTVRREGEPLVVRETWVVTGESQMRVTLEGKGALKGLVQGTMIYEPDKKYFIDGNSQRLMSQRLGEDWLEPLFHFRSSKYLRNRLVHLKIAPPESLRDRPAMPSDSEVKYDPPGFIRLSRVGGGISWAIGIPPSTAMPNPPTLWLEQDEFVVRKARTADQTLLRADDYAKFDEGLRFPRLRSYSNGKITVDIRTVSVKSLGKVKGDDARFKNSSLNPARDAVKFPEADTLKEFYARYR